MGITYVPGIFIEARFKLNFLYLYLYIFLVSSIIIAILTFYG